MLTAKPSVYALAEHILKNPHLDPAGINVARAQMVLGLLYKIKEKSRPSDSTSNRGKMDTILIVHHWDAPDHRPARRPLDEGSDRRADKEPPVPQPARAGTEAEFESNVSYCR